MLSQLYIENIAVIRQATIDFSKGFHVFTGETGAGKTILISAINAVLGGRTFKEIIRTGETRATVSALFTEIPPVLCEKISALGFSPEDGQLLVQREIDLSGKGQCRLDGRPATAAMLREVCSLLIDIHGQHDNQELLSAEKHLGFLDSYGEYNNELAAYTDAYERMCDCATRLDKLQVDESYKLQRMDILQFQLKEIGDAKLLAGEEEQLTEQQKCIRNAERITESLGAVYTLLNGDGEELKGALETLEEVSSELDIAAKYLPEFGDYGEKLSDAYYMLEELGSRARDTLEEADFDPRRLDAIESRLDTIYKLKKKYGGSIAEILEYFDKISEEYQSLELSDELTAKLQMELDEANTQLRAASEALTASRLAAAAGDEPPDHHGRMTSQLVFALLCELSGADSAAPALPPLVTAAIEDIRQNYAGLYGVEELSERLGVSKSHLVRTFTAAVGVPPGRYLTTVRIEAAMRLLLHREYTLDVIASLCGFSGANYLCRVFKKETGQSPAQWRAMAGQAVRPLSPAENRREQELYI
mgnify:CR=1 FL=1